MQNLLSIDGDLITCRVMSVRVKQGTNGPFGSH